MRPLPRTLPSARHAANDYQRALADAIAALRADPAQSAATLARSHGIAPSTLHRYAKLAGWTPPRLLAQPGPEPEPATRRAIPGQCLDCQCQTVPPTSRPITTG